MGILNNLKPIVDLPVFEWPRPLPSTPGSTSGWAASVKKGARWIYYLNSTTFMRYDTYGDAWTQLAGLPATPSGVLDLKIIENSEGYSTRLISQPTTNSIRVAGIMPGSLEGTTVKVMTGTGTGQERTIIGETLTVYDTGSVTSASTTGVVDTNKNWAFNQWRGYQVRLVVGGGSMQIRKIISNTSNTLMVHDINYVNYDRDAAGAFTVTTSASAGTNTQYQIEACDLTLNAPFTTTPSLMSMLTFNTGSIFATIGFGVAPWHYMYRYDIATDVWYQMITNNAFGTTTLGTDISIAATATFRDPIATGNVTSATSTTITLANNIGLTTNSIRYFLVRIKSGLGEGQERIIMSNTASVLTVKDAWAITPNATSEYEILPDYDKQWAMGNGQALMMQYSTKDNIWSNNFIHETGIARQGSVTLVSEPSLSFAISTATRSGTTATITTVMTHNFRVGDSIISAGASQSQYNGTFTIVSVPSTTTFTYAMASDPGASGTYTAQSTTVIVDAAKNWGVNSLVGRSVMINSAASAAQQTNQIRRILSNTANTITISGTAITAATNGTSKYAIIDNDCFGAIESGTATGTGSTTTLVDTTKTWAINQWAGLRIRFTSGPLIGQESVITSNTATVITTTSAFTASTDTSSGYAILPIQARGAGMCMRYAFGMQEPNQLRGRYIYSFRGGATTHVDRYNIAANTWERFTAIPWVIDTFTTGTSYAYDDVDNIYIFQAATHRIYQFNLKTFRVNLVGIAPYTAGTSILGNRAEIIETEDGLNYLYVNRSSAVDIFRTLLFLPSNVK